MFTSLFDTWKWLLDDLDESLGLSRRWPGEVSITSHQRTGTRLGHIFLPSSGRHNFDVQITELVQLPMLIRMTFPVVQFAELLRRQVHLRVPCPNDMNRCN